jgi:parallel beta-helix repeat protein
MRRFSVGTLVLAAVAGCLALGTGRASASQLSCGDTITADTKLHSNLVNCPNNGIVIGADDITLDLNGHTIDGDGKPFGCVVTAICDVGIANADGHVGVRIEGGSVKEFEFGVLCDGAADNRLSDLAASSNFFSGISLFDSTDSRVVKSSADHNGLTTESNGIQLFGSRHVRIERNSVSGNGDNGIFVGESDHNLIANNRSFGNFAALVVNGNGNVVSRNVTRNAGDIIVVGNRNVITQNHVADSLGCPDGCGIGISLEGGHDNLIAHNFVNHASFAGIRVAAFEPDTPPAVDNVVRRNHVRRAHDGFLVQSTASDTLLEGNHAVRSEDDGIDVNSRTTTITGNHAVHNGDFGIEAVVGVIDGGGNKARGNGNPAQCLNVVCK